MKNGIAFLILCVMLFPILEARIMSATTSELARALTLPDLVVTDFWQEDNFVYYQVRNIGNATAGEGHVTTLLINDAETARDEVHNVLAPGERYNGLFQLPKVEVSAQDILTQDELSVRLADLVAVCADYYDKIAESDEANNAKAEVWSRDTTPPAITAGPTVVGLTQTTAVISWITDEASESCVKYSETTGVYDLRTSTSDLTRAHNMSLRELEPSTTYRFTVQSTDPSGNIVESRELTFQTTPYPDLTAPTLPMISLPDAVQAMINVQAEASDDGDLEKMEFYMDGLLMFTDFSLPYEVALNTSKFENGPHTLTAVAFDLAGNRSSKNQTINVANLQDKTIPTVKFTNLKDGDDVSRTVSLKVDLHDDVGLDFARFYVNGNYTEFNPFVNKPKDVLSLAITYDVSKLENGSKLTLAVEAWDVNHNVGTANVRVFVYNAEPVEPKPPPHPWLKVTGHAVDRLSNVFTIWLGIENIGDATAFNIRILDGLKGFQPISADLSAANYSAECNPNGWASMYIKPQNMLLAGDLSTYTYNAVPVLLSVPTTPEIGYFVEFYWEDASQNEYHDFVKLPAYQTIKGESISQAYEGALKTCDYLIVTNTYELRAYYDPGYYSQSPYDQSGARGEVNNLLSTMAQLAYHKQGVLGYLTLNSYSPQVLRSLIQQGGSWSSKLKSDWTSNGYLLIVGEDEIVPAWIWTFGPVETLLGSYIWKGLTDSPYASTCGEAEIPELSIGRIIGNSPKELKAVINNSLSVYLGLPGHEFDRSKILAASGFPGTPPNDIDFKANRNDVLNVVAQKDPNCLQFKLHTPDLAEYNAIGGIDWPKTNWAIQDALISGAKDIDIIYLAGHGSAVSWDGVFTDNITGWKYANPFGNTSPFVYAFSCRTGTYSAVFGLAESFLQRGAAAYLGATTDGYGRGSQSVRFFELWDANEPISLAVKQTKISLGDSDADKVWRASFHVYGDAKFGTVQSVANSALVSSSLSIIQPGSPIDLLIPDYAVTSVDGNDYVQIPNGLQLSLASKPQIPYYKVLYEYPKGYRIQDVTLKRRSEPITATGLNIPNTVLALVGDGGTILPQSSGGSTEWFPEKSFEWRVYEGPDCTILALTVYPFCYNALTTDVKFYKEYSFEVSYVASSVKITSLEMDSQVYDLGEDVHFDLGLANSGSDGRNVMVNTFIRDESSGQVLGGAPLRTLANLRGDASYSSKWSSVEVGAGDYDLVVELRDSEGLLLDRRIQSFRLGIRSGEITSFTVAPAVLRLGENVLVQIDFRNNGSVVTNGTAVMRIIGSDGSIVGEFDHEIGDLAPSQSVRFTDTWNPSNVTAGSYDFVGFVLYDGVATDPKTVQIEITSSPKSAFDLFIDIVAQYAHAIIIAIFIIIAIVITIAVIARKRRK